MDIYKPPTSQLSDKENGVKKSIYWRIYFWLHLAIIPLFIYIVFFTTISEINILDYIDMSLFPITTIALYSYIYSKKILSSKTYSYVFYFYFLWVIFYEFIAPLVLKIPSYGKVEEVEFDIFYLIYILYVPMFYALFKLGKKQDVKKNA